MALHPVDSAILILYFVVVLAAAVLGRKVTDTTDYLLMGRRLTLPAFVLTLVSSWYGGIFGVSEFTYSYGISNWIVMGVPYYVFGLIFALFFARAARRHQVFSIPHLLRTSYGPRAEALSGWIVLLLATPAPYVLSTGLLLQFVFKIPLIWAIIISAATCYLYVVRGGLSSVVKADIVQCILMYIGFAVLVGAAWLHFGSPSATLHKLATSHPLQISPSGGNSVSYILVWFFIASWTLIDPGFHQRVYAAQTEATARTGIIISVVFWAVFDCMTTFSGLYALAWLPPLHKPADAFLILGRQVLPTGLYGLFLAGLLAVIMSTLESTAFISGATLGKDLVPNWLKDHSEKTISRLTKIGTAAALLFAAVLAILLPSVVDLFYTIGSLAVPGLLLPVTTAIAGRGRVPAGYAVANIVVAPLVALAWMLLPTDWLPAAWQVIEPFYPGIVASLILWAVGLAHTRTRSNA